MSINLRDLESGGMCGDPLKWLLSNSGIRIIKLKVVGTLKHKLCAEMISVATGLIVPSLLIK